MLNDPLVALAFGFTSFILIVLAIRFSSEKRREAGPRYQVYCDRRVARRDIWK